MRKVDIYYHIRGRLSARDCAKLEHILRNHRGVRLARFCQAIPQTLVVQYDADRISSALLLSRIRMLNHEACILG